MATNPPKQPQAKQTKTHKTAIPFKKIITPVVILVVCLLVPYFWNFHGAWGDQGDFGAFGDFFGGILNPILGFVTVCLLIWSLNIQLNELSLSREELCLTRQELAETKEETALSRKAMEAQVEHLQKEAKLNELVRLISDLRIQFQTQISSKLYVDNRLRNILCNADEKIPSKYIEDTYKKINNLNIYNILYEEDSFNARNSWYIRHFFLEKYKNDVLYGGYTKLTELEIILVNFSRLVLKYYDLSNNPDLAYIYLDEARRMVTPFHKVLESDVIEPWFIKIQEMLACRQSVESSGQILPQNP